MDRVTCCVCMFWEPIEKHTRDGKQLGECRRFPTPPVVERAKDWWCGEGVHKSLSPQGGRNK